jgi:hypothetical protein
VTPGVVLAGTLRGAGYSRARGLYDSLAIGPITRSLPRLDTLRREHAAGRLGWTGHYRMGELGRAVNDLRAGAVLWTTDSWRNRLSLWCLLHALGDDAVGIPLVYPARDGVSNEYFDLSRREIARCLAAAHPIDARMIAEASMLWRVFAAREPRGLVQLRWSSLRAFSDARALFGAYARMLPRERLSRRGPRWRLSWLDDVLIRRFSRDRWATPLRWMKAEPLAMELISERGDMDLLERMLELTEGSHALLESRVVPDKVGDWVRVELRLSERGDRALKVGIEELRSIPARAIGGHFAYRSPCWVAVRTGVRWSIAEAG